MMTMKYKWIFLLLLVLSAIAVFFVICSNGQCFEGGAPQNDEDISIDDDVTLSGGELTDDYVASDTNDTIIDIQADRDRESREPADNDPIEITLRTPTSTPEPVQALYITSWVAGTPSLREPIIDMVLSTNINAVIIDIKDDTGKISYRVNDEILASYGSSENRIPNIDALLERFHDAGIYVIGRISVFQDPYLASARPDLAVLTKSDGNVWTDRKGLSFLHPQYTEVWDYTLRLAKESYERGFDEINFDYVRFPSDGNISDIDYALEEGSVRADHIENFFAYVYEELKDHPMKTSVDLFGMTTTQSDDLGIGQIWERALPYFDYIAPMIYPSHYPPTWRGFNNPADHPYEVITYALQGALEKSNAHGYDGSTIRAWIQDFNHKAVYTEDMVLDQIRAARELGIESFMIWNPSNRYRIRILEEI